MENLEKQNMKLFYVNFWNEDMVYNPEIDSQYTLSITNQEITIECQNEDDIVNNVEFIRLNKIFEYYGYEDITN